MGNGVTKVGDCFAGAGEISGRHDIAFIIGMDPLHDGLGHSFCYFRPDPARISSSKVHADETTTFRSISGASVSANTSTPPSTALVVDACPYSSGLDRASTFESSDSFASIPLQPVPRRSFQSVPASGPMERGFVSGPIERGFASGPIERGFVSGPIDRGLYSGTIGKGGGGGGDINLQKSSSHVGGCFDIDITDAKPKKRGLIKIFKRMISNTISRGRKSIVAPVKTSVSVKESVTDTTNHSVNAGSSANSSGHVSLTNDNDDDGEFSMQSQNLQWAQGKAGEDRVHIVISEEHGWVFVGIYDGFNGPDAPDYLLNHLYSALHKEVKGLLWDDKFDSTSVSEETTTLDSVLEIDADLHHDLKTKQGSRKTAKKWEENQRRWKCEWDRERVELDRKLKEQLNCKASTVRAGGVNHSDVLRAISMALRKTEDAYLEAADKMVTENPELALMGSCVLVMLMKGEDVYLINVGDSRAVLARRDEPNLGIGKPHQDLEGIKEETMHDLEEELDRLPNLTAHQLTMDHSTYVDEEVYRIMKEHPDDDSAIMNDRVKGYLKVTRAFGAGFLKQPKWNDALLEMFRINYIGTAPYITCLPSHHHHRLDPRDKFLILSSDGLYQYFTNEEAVSEVESFIASFPEGDPAQHLIEEVLFRAAKKAGMDFHELLEIPQGERRRYHDDVSVIIISLEGRIWRSSV